MRKRGRQIIFFVDHEFFERLEDARWQARLSRSEYIRKAIEEKLERERGKG